MKLTRYLLIAVVMTLFWMPALQAEPVGPVNDGVYSHDVMADSVLVAHVGTCSDVSHNHQMPGKLNKSPFTFEQLSVSSDLGLVDYERIAKITDNRTIASMHNGTPGGSSIGIIRSARATTH